MDGLHSRFGTFGEFKNVLTLAENKGLSGNLVQNVVAISTGLLGSSLSAGPKNKQILTVSPIFTNPESQ